MLRFLLTDHFITKQLPKHDENVFQVATELQDINKAFHKVSSVQQKESSTGNDKLSHEAIVFAELVSYIEANR